MELHPLVEVLFFGVVGLLFVIAVLWFFAGYGAWMDDAFDGGRWIWFGFLLVFAFPTSLIAWLIVRAMGRTEKQAI